MNKLAYALIPLAVLTMGFSKQQVDASSGPAFHNSLQSMIAPLEQAQKEELVMAVFAVVHYHQCMAAGNANGRGSVRQHCGNTIPTIPHYARYYLETGRMDNNVEWVRTVTTIFGPAGSTTRGHSMEQSWTLGARYAKPHIHGKSGEALLAAYRSLVANEKKEAVTQTEIDTAIGDAHEFVYVLKKQRDILASNGGSEADRAKCAASIAWIENELVRVELLKSGQRVPVADRTPYAYRACDGVGSIR